MRLIAVILFAAAVWLTGGGVPLCIPNLPSARSGGALQRAEAAVIAEFKRLHPEAELESFGAIGLPGMSLDARLMFAIAGGTAPDILPVDIRQLATWRAKGLLAPLEGLSLPEGIPAPLQDALTEGGCALWAVPLVWRVKMLVWRKDLFQNAGLDPSSPPKSVEELKDFARRLTLPESHQYGLEISHDSIDDFCALWTAAGRDAAAADAVFAGWAEMLRAGSVTRSVQTGGLAASAMSLQWIDSRSMGGWMDRATIGISAIPPAVAGASPPALLSAELYGLFAGIKDRKNAAGEIVPAAAIRSLALEYLSFIASESANQLRADAIAAAGSASALAPSWLERYGYPEYLPRFPKEYADAFTNAAQDLIADTAPAPELSRALAAAEQRIREGKTVPAGWFPAALSSAAPVRAISRTSRLWAAAVAVFLFSLLAAEILWLWRNSAAATAPAPRASGSRRRSGWLLALPALLCIIVWNYLPMAIGTAGLFHELSFVSPPRWNGLDNLAAVLSSAEWWRAVANTLKYMAMNLGCGFLVPLALAVMLAEVRRGTLLYRILFFLPGILNAVCVVYLWRLFYGAGSEGILNQALNALACGHWNNVDWLADERWAMAACVLPAIWAAAGPGSLVYLAALKTIPQECYDAAALDGAGFWSRLRLLTLPALKPLIALNFAAAFICAAQSGGTMLILTYGRANTEVAELLLFKEAYTKLNFGSAIAMAWLLSALTSLAAVWLYRQKARVKK